jgi:hypothetical protein
MPFQQSPWPSRRHLSGGRFMTTKPTRSRCSTRRLATIADMSSSASWTRLAALEAQGKGERVGDVFAETTTAIE